MEDLLEPVKRRPGTQGARSRSRKAKAASTSLFLQPAHHPTDTIERQAARRDSFNHRRKVLANKRAPAKHLRAIPSRVADRLLPPVRDQSGSIFRHCHYFIAPIVGAALHRLI